MPDIIADRTIVQNFCTCHMHQQHNRGDVNVSSGNVCDRLMAAKVAAKLWKEKHQKNRKKVE